VGLSGESLETCVNPKYVCALGRFSASLVVAAGASAVRRRLFILTLLLALPSSAWAQLVTRVVDGDTIVVAGVGTVRLIGVDTPETVDPRAPVQFFGKEASEFTRRMAEHKFVRLEFDTQRTDKYQRTLSYVYLPDGTFLNAEIVKQGFGHAYVTYPFKYLDQFRGYEREAREARRGLWADPPSVAEQKALSIEPVRVWVNTASQVYHCPGTRYYGNTSRGAYMTEAEAQEKGYRAAYGRSCGPGSTASAPIATDSANVPGKGSTAQSTGASDTRVWVNTSSRVYHCPGTRYYGNTAHGAYMTESEATRQGHRPAGGRSCGLSSSMPAAAAVPSSRSSDTIQADASDAPRAGDPATRVWVNTSSRVYHCPGTRYYGATKNGQHMRQDEAQAAGYRPAAGKFCS
jgi:micrococcal nuclease